MTPVSIFDVPMAFWHWFWFRGIIPPGGDPARYVRRDPRMRYEVGQPVYFVARADPSIVRWGTVEALPDQNQGCYRLRQGFGRQHDVDEVDMAGEWAEAKAVQGRYV